MSSATPASVSNAFPRAIRTWTDENTGREIRLITNAGGRVSMNYFREVKHVFDGRIMIRRSLLDLTSGTWERPPLPDGASTVQLHPDGRRLYWLTTDGAVGLTRLDTHEMHALGHIGEPDPKAAEHAIIDEGDAMLIACRREDLEKHPLPHGNRDGCALHAWLERPRSGDITRVDLATGTHRRLVTYDDHCAIHIDPSPRDPTLFKFAHDKYDAYCQRIWTMRSDGSDLKPIRKQQHGELVTHEFWWPDGSVIAYKYQDRRNDPTLADTPWAEYAPVATQFGLADLDGNEVYLSDPLNHYHSHINVSRCGNWLSGEGTDGNSFVFVAPFDRARTRVDFQPLATIHTEYVPFGGQGVSADFTADGKWLLYNDWIDERRCICAVRTDA